MICVTHNDLRQCVEDAVQFECIHNYYDASKDAITSFFSDFRNVVS